MPYASSVGYLNSAPGILIYNEDSLLYVSGCSNMFAVKYKSQVPLL